MEIPFWLICGTIFLTVGHAAVLPEVAVDPNAVVGSLEHLESLELIQRIRRDLPVIAGPHRGQTQSQYMSYGSGGETGTAEAEISEFGSRAKVISSNGMGQAQSQSSTGDCSSCGGGLLSSGQVLDITGDKLIKPRPSRPGGDKTSGNGGYRSPHYDDRSEHRPTGPEASKIRHPDRGSSPGRGPGGSGSLNGDSAPGYDGSVNGIRKPIGPEGRRDGDDHYRQPGERDGPGYYRDRRPGSPAVDDRDTSVYGPGRRGPSNGDGSPSYSESGNGDHRSKDQRARGPIDGERDYGSRGPKYDHQRGPGSWSSTNGDSRRPGDNEETRKPGDSGHYREPGDHQSRRSEGNGKTRHPGDGGQYYEPSGQRENGENPSRRPDSSDRKPDLNDRESPKYRQEGPRKTTHDRSYEDGPKRGTSSGPGSSEVSRRPGSRDPGRDEDSGDYREPGRRGDSGDYRVPDRGGDNEGYGPGRDRDDRYHEPGRHDESTDYRGKHPSDYDDGGRGRGGRPGDTDSRTRGPSDGRESSKYGPDRPGSSSRDGSDYKPGDPRLRGPDSRDRDDSHRSPQETRRPGIDGDAGVYDGPGRGDQYGENGSKPASFRDDKSRNGKPELGTDVTKYSKIPGDHKYVTYPGLDHTVLRPEGGVTVLVGDGEGTKQTVIGSDGRPIKVIPGPADSNLHRQTVYTGHPTGLTVLVGTGGPTQTVHHYSGSLCGNGDLASLKEKLCDSDKTGTGFGETRERKPSDGDRSAYDKIVKPRPSDSRHYDRRDRDKYGPDGYDPDTDSGDRRRTDGYDKYGPGFRDRDRPSGYDNGDRGTGSTPGESDSGISTDRYKPGSRDRDRPSGHDDGGRGTGDGYDSPSSSRDRGHPSEGDRDRVDDSRGSDGYETDRDRPGFRDRDRPSGHDDGGRGTQTDRRGSGGDRDGSRDGYDRPSSSRDRGHPSDYDDGGRGKGGRPSDTDSGPRGPNDDRGSDGYGTDRNRPGPRDKERPSGYEDGGRKTGADRRGSGGDRDGSRDGYDGPSSSRDRGHPSDYDDGGRGRGGRHGESDSGTRVPSDGRGSDGYESDRYKPASRDRDRPSGHEDGGRRTDTRGSGGDRDGSRDGYEGHRDRPSEYDDGGRGRGTGKRGPDGDRDDSGSGSRDRGRPSGYDDDKGGADTGPRGRDRFDKNGYGPSDRRRPSDYDDDGKGGDDTGPRGRDRYDNNGYGPSDRRRPSDYDDGSRGTSDDRDRYDPDSSEHGTGGRGTGSRRDHDSYGPHDSERGRGGGFSDRDHPSGYDDKGRGAGGRGDGRNGHGTSDSGRGTDDFDNKRRPYDERNRGTGTREEGRDSEHKPPSKWTDLDSPGTGQTVWSDRDDDRGKWDSKDPYGKDPIDESWDGGRRPSDRGKWGTDSSTDKDKWDGQAPANIVAHGSGTGDDDGDSQAQSSVKDGEAMASAQGTKNGGTAQTQVSGTYGGTGSFSASAQTSDKDRAAQAQVKGDKDGAMSSAQGTGGKGKSQTQVAVKESGGTSASAQSGGADHESQSEVQANEKGGLADAQSSGPGQTSSQAQIGFKPEGEGDDQPQIFNGGGSASAQSSGLSGQTQSQIKGNFKYGISYHGAAQSASGTKDQVAKIREKNRELFHSISQYKNGIGKTSSVSSADDMQYKTSQKSVVSLPGSSLISDSKIEDEIEYEDDDEEYDEDDYYTMDKSGLETKSSSDNKKPIAEINDEKLTISKTSDSVPGIFSQISPNQKQVAVVSDPNAPYKVIQSQNGKTQIHEQKDSDSTTEAVPEGFNGRIEEPEKKPSSKISYENTKYPTRFLPSKHADANKIDSDDVEDKKSSKPDSYVTVTKSVTGSLDDTPPSSTGGKNFSQTFYTKSSTCGYFTFSCNIVYGANGKSKICKPKPPTNGKC